MTYFEVNSDEDLIDKQWLSDLKSRYNLKRNQDLKTCNHEHWSKFCTCCKRVVSSELTDINHKDYLKLKEDYLFLEKILIKIILR